MINVPVPTLQVGFSVALAEIRNSLLQDALKRTVETLDIASLDRQLAEFVPPRHMRMLASNGLRAELVFPVPLVLRANPALLGYYRLLYGFSQKQFYGRATGAARFKAMEESGRISAALEDGLDALCHSWASAGAFLVEGIGADRLNALFLDDLTLLTLGPQLRGGANVKKGAEGIAQVFGAILEIVRPAVVTHTASSIEIRNSSRRKVQIEFAPDPDIITREEMSPDNFHPLVAIEVKAGSDFSNIHNRLGEAEKSHQKARAAGFSECWTVVNVDQTDLALAKRESPTTNHFYRLSDIRSGTGEHYAYFRWRVLSLVGIPEDDAFV